MVTISRRGPTIDEMQRPSSGPLFGKYKGNVEDNADPNKRGRLKVSVKDITDTEGIWAEPCVPFAGADRAFFALPPQGTGVWVEFLGGNISKPVYCGFYWREGELDSADYNPDRLHLQMENFRIDVMPGGNEAVIAVKEGGTITIKNGEITIKGDKITQDAGGNAVVLDGTAFDVKNAALKVV